MLGSKLQSLQVQMNRIVRFSNGQPSRAEGRGGLPFEGKGMHLKCEPLPHFMTRHAMTGESPRRYSGSKAAGEAGQLARAKEQQDLVIDLVSQMPS
jgi:hypothetical protein